MTPVPLLRPLSWLMLLLGGLISAVIFFSYGGLAQDQPTPAPIDPTPTQPPVVYIPPDRGMPGNREGGGSRGCGQAIYNPPLVAIISDEHVGRTMRDHPTILWVAPGVADKTLIFNINTEEEKIVFQRSFSGRDQAEISGITLPPETPALEVGKNYHWYLSLVCDPQARSGDVVVDAWVRRVSPDPDLQTQLQASTLAESPALLAKAGLWYDTLAAVAQLRQQDPTDPVWQSTWSSVLTEVGLSGMADLPWSTPLVTVSLPQPLG